MRKLKLILSTSIAAAFALSCSTSGDGSGGGGNITEAYTLEEITDSQFTYKEAEYYYCAEGGVLETEDDTYSNIMKYSIDNKILTVGDVYYWPYDTLNFKGTSDALIGTWTRTKNKAASCELETSGRYVGDEEYFYWDCKYGWNITKAVFTDKTVKFTVDYCATDEIVDGTVWPQGEAGWKMRVVSCDTYEVYKNSTKVTIKETAMDTRFSYNGNTCSMSWAAPSKSKRESACKEAWDKHKDDEYWDDYYYDILRSNRYDFWDCLEKKMPAGFFTDDDGDSDDYEKNLPIMKAKKLDWFKKY